jgi:hypothetical protein
VGYSDLPFNLPRIADLFLGDLGSAAAFLLCYEITDLFDAPITILMALVKHKH